MRVITRETDRKEYDIRRGLNCCNLINVSAPDTAQRCIVIRILKLKCNSEQNTLQLLINQLRLAIHMRLKSNFPFPNVFNLLISTVH